MIDTQDSITFFVNGFIHGHIAEAESFPVGEYRFVDCTSDIDGDTVAVEPGAVPWLDKFAQLIEQRYISQIFDQYTLVEKNMWSGVDLLSATWHNDQFYDNPRFNSNVLLYLDDSMQQNNIAIHNGQEEFVIYPRVGDIVWLNQQHRFKHKATHRTGNRRLMSFEYMIPALID